ncbi:hypothetical protein HS1genome_1496 [Sulfodiicoccus acidiphilus]|uniref:Uncharacterized protein n=1 Tax=Sulfodiicoccus acidiphilus TaxID=1670455 RepID=A0A348B4K5_9CREN|nr:hypothetical protein [Sulfodiicoccus acidiphilus]BBD73107.1 hypothetical protein HS1genome_1496 [Sulfodiicoccus acidiphilus]GGU00735.1 hypothetical protein GCM10007116_17500 [Sulfodiicoccus acidiphilus]
MMSQRGGALGLVILVLLLALLIVALISPIFLLGSVPLALGVGSQDKYGIPLGAVSLLAYFLHGVYYVLAVSLMIGVVALVLLKYVRSRAFYCLDRPFLLLRFMVIGYCCSLWGGVSRGKQSAARGNTSFLYLNPGRPRPTHSAKSLG